MPLPVEIKPRRSPLDEVVRAQHARQPRGIYSVCSAHPLVLEAAIAQSLDDGTVLLIESTSNQVNQFGGYMRQTPAQFAEAVRMLAAEHGLPADKLLLGGDHLGPHPFRSQPADEAMAQAGEMIRAYVAAGYQKIHLDTSMACGGDAVGTNGAPDERLAAGRAAQLCAIAEAAALKTFGSSDHLRYVVGTEVPPPGGETGSATIQLTKPADVERTIDAIRAAFESQGLSPVWNRVIAVVVQPGVDFSDSAVVDYDRRQAAPLRQAIESHLTLVYEAHSTDYQRSKALRELVEDHFAILKVGPWLTFTFRETVFALEAVETEWLGRRRSVHLSRLRETMDEIMRGDPTHWRGHYVGDETEILLARAFSYSDRIRYYWPDAAAEKALRQLLVNLEAPPPMSLVSQYLPHEYRHLRESGQRWDSRAVLIRAIRRVLAIYAQACKGEPS